MKTTLSVSLAVLTFIGVTRAATPDSAPPQAAPKPAQPAAPQTGGVVLPRVQFQNTPFNEAVDFLRVKSRELDPRKKGLNIVVKPGGNPDVRITLGLAGLPLNEALRYCAQLANYTLSFDGDVAVLTPLTATR